MMIAHLILAVVWIFIYASAGYYLREAKKFSREARETNREAIATLRKYNEWLEEDMRKPSLVIVEDGTIDG